MGVNLSNSSYDGNLLFLPLTLRLSWTLLARKYWRYFNENNCSLPEEFTQFRPATARGKVVKNVSPESTKASGSPEALSQMALALHIHWYVVCPFSHCVPLLVVSLWCCRVWNHNSEILTREGEAQSKVQVRGRRGWGHGLSPLQLQMEAGHNCQSDTAGALWALSQLPAVTVAAELFTAPELSVSSEGGGSAAALSSCTGSWLCPSPQTEVVFPFCPCQWHKGIFSPKILHNLCNFWTENRECCSHAWGGGMWKSRTNFFTSTAQSERWRAQFLPCNILQQIGRELGCPFPFGIHLLCYPLCELSLPWRVCLSHGEIVVEWIKQIQTVVTIPVKCFALRVLYHVSALSHSSHQKCSSVLRMWKWVLASGLWHCSQLGFSTALFLLVLTFHDSRPSGFPCLRPWCPHRNPLVHHSVHTLNVSTLAFVTPSSKSCVLSLLWWMNRNCFVTQFLNILLPNWQELGLGVW